MTIKISRKNLRGLSRRRFLSAAAVTGAGALGAIAMPYLSRAADRPQITHGVQSGDIGADGGVVWGRADRGAARERLHPENAFEKSPRRAGYFLSRAIPRPRASRHFKRAGRRPLP